MILKTESSIKCEKASILLVLEGINERFVKYEINLSTLSNSKKIRFV